ncbi:MAG: DNA adenine methylase [Candidatus Phytoplasma pyri]|uniref:DNA adenine methylase n=1 Tax=Candidatus Phytoplasma pyri TaxID=47566 RepID=UPI003983A407
MGSKKKIIPQILPLIPKNYQTYIEPFLGSGALYLALMPKKAIINDHNSHLIQLWKTFLQTPHPFYQQVIKLEKQLFQTSDLTTTKQQFQSFITQFNHLQAQSHLKISDLIFKNALFLIINKYSYKSILYRPNCSVLKADWGYHPPIQQILNLADLMKISQHFHQNQHQIHQLDYLEIIQQANPQDFLFLDPPYFFSGIETKKYNFYHTPFTWADHEKLAYYLKKLDQQGTKWLYMNYDTPAIRTLFTNFMACSLPSSTHYNSQKLPEIIILNYQIKS